MTTYTSQPAILFSRSLAERLVCGVRKTLRAAGIDRTHNREVRAVDDLSGMNEHMLRDIGLHDHVISHATAASEADHRPWISVRLSTPFFLLALIATAVLTATEQATGSPPNGKADTQARVNGVFTGEYLNGAPVYRLPPVSVIASRKVEPGKLEREDQSTRARQARAKAAARQPT